VEAYLQHGEGEPVWLTPHLRDPQPEGEKEKLSFDSAISLRE